jgi:hypothetical protein
MKKLITITAICLLLGAVLWNGWVFGWLNHGSAGYFHMSISELEVISQPGSFVFRSLDFISGIFLMLSAAGLLFITKARPILLGLIAICIGLIGFLTIFDVSHPLDCDSYNNNACITNENRNHVSYSHVLHLEESALTAYITVFLILFTVVWVYLTGQSKFRLSVGLAVFFGIFIALYIMQSSGYIVANSVSERFWNVLVSSNIAFMAFILFREEHRKPNIRKLDFSVRPK